jgi:hypothetical protein
MQPLHDDDDGAGLLVVQPTVDRVVERRIRRVSAGIGLGIVGLDGIVDASPSRVDL